MSYHYCTVKNIHLTRSLKPRAQCCIISKRFTIVSVDFAADLAVFVTRHSLQNRPDERRDYGTNDWTHLELIFGMISLELDYD